MDQERFRRERRFGRGIVDYREGGRFDGLPRSRGAPDRGKARGDFHYRVAGPKARGRSRPEARKRLYRSIADDLHSQEHSNRDDEQPRSNSSISPRAGGQASDSWRPWAPSRSSSDGAISRI